ncbi:hypothetical protein [Mycobacterium sp. ITM-2016-00318]|uniref:DUF7159 family protein n=1 Tax=Mycobacterium sp. ITM-2016-00318 TaxID=2099693 RepID=UPI000CF84B8D|nr:hypothetical protein [Mycobacterium sp. ITM-2016-00318]WNG93581.1 hypothetical protein C6A82_003650 [Mycobacterium sp. ITM-2016-00318]
MDLVLGLSVTSTAVRWVLVEGVTGDGDAVDRGVLDVADPADFDADALLTVLLDANEAVVESGLHAAGVTWTPAGEVVAGAILEALQARDVQDAIAVSELEAAEALASGISAISGYQDVAVCVFEPDSTLVALVDAGGVTVDPQDMVPDRDVELSASVMALDLNDRQLDAIFVVGSANLEPVVSSMDSVAAAPVISSAEADMAMARGAAVASAMAVISMGGGSASLFRLREMSRTSVLTAVVVGAAVTLVISLSVVLGLQATSDSPSETKNANATTEQLNEGKFGAEAKAALAAPKPAQRPAAPAPKPAAKPAPAPAAPPPAQTRVASPPAPVAIPDVDPPAAAPPAPAYVPPAPAYTPPAPAYTPPAPAYTPPAPAYTPPAPAYTPPAPQVPAVQPEPRLRDKIIERIPIINRFHDPQPMYPTN